MKASAQRADALKITDFSQRLAIIKYLKENVLKFTYRLKWEATKVDYLVENDPAMELL